MKNIYMTNNNEAKSLIRWSEADQYYNLEKYGAMAMVSKEFIENAPVIATNGVDVMYQHPAEPNVAILVFGQNDNEIFGVILDREIHCADGSTVKAEKVLEKLWCLKMAKTRGFLVNNLTKSEVSEYHKKQLRLEEAIISLSLYGDIRPIRDEQSKDWVIHHRGFPFDLRRNNLAFVSKKEHKAIHRIESEASHYREVKLYTNVRIPVFVGKQEMKKRSSKKVS